MYKDRFISYLKFEKRYSAHTLVAYQKDIESLLNYAELEFVEFEQIDYKFMRYFFSSLKEQGISSRSVNRCISSIKSFYKFLMREGLVSQNPVTLIKSMKTAKKLPVVVEKDKLVKLLEQLDQEEMSFEEVRDFVVMELLFGTGVRLAELLKIREVDIDFYNKKILIFGKRSKERFVPIHNTLVEELKKYISQKKEQQFQNISPYLVVTKEGKSAYPKLISRIVDKYLSMITSQQKRSPHVLRHTFATSLLDNGADLNAIKELLGHAGLAATQVYTHNSAERLKSIYKQAHPKA